MTYQKVKTESENPELTNNTGFLNNLFADAKEKFGEDAFDKWLSKLEILSKNDIEVVFKAPSKFIRDWVRREFIEKRGQNLTKLAKEIEPKLKKISVVYIADSKTVESEMMPAENSLDKSSKVINLSKNDNLFAFGTKLNQKYTFDNFVSGKYNKLALSMAKIASGIDQQICLFDDKIPLFIHGGVGMGKTHLAQSIAWQIKENDSSQKVVYLSAEKFMYHFVQSIRSNDLMTFKEKMRSIDVLIVDDIQFIAGKERTQQEFMNCFNSLVEDNKQVILVCDRCPSNLENIDEKLKSRIAGGMIINFKSPDFNDRLKIVKEKAQSSNIKISDDILNFIAENIKTSVRDLEGGLKKLIAENLFLEQELTIDNAKRILSSHIKRSAIKKVDAKKIKKAVADFYKIDLEDLSKATRSRAIARPRQIAMYLCKNHTSESLPKIGEKFEKNHATVIHALKVIEKLMNENQQILQDVKSIEEKILNQ